MESEAIKMTRPSKQMQERVVVDCAHYHEEVAPFSLDFKSSERVVKVKADERPDLKDEELLICTHEIPAFSLLTKKWVYLDITKLETVSFNETAFRDMILSAEHKRMIEALVKAEGENPHDGHDLITGKGRGIVFLLYGPPGVGKTLTAGMRLIPHALKPRFIVDSNFLESISDHSHRPLYTINCSDLSHKPSVVERSLQETLALAKRWNAITLVDEADVFMARRSINDLRRNELVSGKYSEVRIRAFGPGQSLILD